MNRQTYLRTNGDVCLRVVDDVERFDLKRVEKSGDRVYRSRKRISPSKEKSFVNNRNFSRTEMFLETFYNLLREDRVKDYKKN
jgi:hypothetical protein